MAIGLAMGGMRPVAEIQFAGFLYPALDQILSHLGRWRHRSRGRVGLPVVVRAPYGGGVHTPEQHADSPEAILAHTPGVKVVIPSSPERAKGLLLSAIEDEDPVFFLEAIKLYRSARAPVPEGYYTLPLGKARVVRQGKAATLIGYGGMVEVMLEAAEVAAREGVEVMVVDLETLVPLDEDTLLEAVRETGRGGGGLRGHAHRGLWGRGGRPHRRRGHRPPRGPGPPGGGVRRPLPALQRH
jgi:pyruvate dehydrogenase E1 component beta subunit